MSAISDLGRITEAAQHRQSRSAIDLTAATSRVAAGILCALPALLTLYLSFNSGGYFAGAQAVVVALLAVVIAVRAVVVRSPFAGLSRSGVIAMAALLAYAAWSLLSSRWSHSPSRALISFDLAALYALAVLLFGSASRSHRRVRWTLGLLWGAMLTVCIAALATRLHPDAFPIPLALSPNRLAFPLTYWNALGLFAAIGLVLGTHLASSRQGGRSLRVVATAASPVFAVTILLTYSRAAVVLAFAGVLAYAVLGRPHGIVGALMAGVPTSGVALVATYHARLVSNAVASPPAVAQGHHLVSVIVLACIAAAAARTALLGLDVSLGSIAVSPAASRRVRRWAALVAVATAAVCVVALHASIVHEWHSFVQSDSSAGSSDVRNRIGSLHIGGRLPGWRIALAMFKAHPLNGMGADTFAIAWNRVTPGGGTALQAHSLYLQALGELGLPGLLALIIAFVTMLVALVRARRRSRSLWSAIIVVTAMWLVHAGVDWDWQMPALTLPVLALAAGALARRGAPRPIRPAVENALRVIVALVAVAVAFNAASLGVSDGRLSASVSEFGSGACAAASADAKASLAAVTSRPQPYSIIGYCEMWAHRARNGVADMRRAVAIDPANWRYRYGLGILEAAAGQDPMPELRGAQRLDPQESLVGTAIAALEHQASRRRSRLALDLQTPVAMRQ